AALLWNLDPSKTELDLLRVDDLRRIGAICAQAASITIGRTGADLPWAADFASESLRTATTSRLTQ
ncbi:MAG: hypothetical protein JWP75_2792, partial [Frondihabitans sp.]|nr:hypothetical protein [Frondihabitans sp.]